VVDDVIATGGTLAATCKLVEKLGGSGGRYFSVIGLTFCLQDKLGSYDINSSSSYTSE